MGRVLKHIQKLYTWPSYPFDDDNLNDDDGDFDDDNDQEDDDDEARALKHNQKLYTSS